jgi:butyryl-CoA dehydrogenase
VDGSMINNNLICAADFQKMGQRGYATTHLIFGEGEPTKGFLVGEVNKGLSYMFQMMNAARIAVGQTAAAVASAAYYNALHYANERPQGRHIADKDISKEQTLIINHADVRRMLLLQKSIIEGSLSLVVECLKWYDLEKVLEGAEKEKAFLLLEILTPIVKTYPSEAGIVSVSNALQVFGGYGFTMDFDAQQYYRDIRIMSIYEGTTAIQSIDLLGRKVPMQSGRALQFLAGEIIQTIQEAHGYDSLSSYSKVCQESVSRFQNVLQYLQTFALKGEVELFMADANLFMELCGLVTTAWQWLKQAVKAQESLINPEINEHQKQFYISKLETMKYFYKYELPKTESLATTIMHADKVTLKKDIEVLI